MKKVAFSLTKVNDFSFKKKGIAFISDNGEDLIIYPNSDYEQIIENCIHYCYPIRYRPGEFKGMFTQYIEHDFEVKGSYETKEIEITYKLWYKVL